MRVKMMKKTTEKKGSKQCDREWNTLRRRSSSVCHAQIRTLSVRGMGTRGGVGVSFGVGWGGMGVGDGLVWIRLVSTRPESIKSDSTYIQHIPKGITRAVPTLEEGERLWHTTSNLIHSPPFNSDNLQFPQIALRCGLPPHTCLSPVGNLAYCHGYQSYRMGYHHCGLSNYS